MNLSGREKKLSGIGGWWRNLRTKMRDKRMTSRWRRAGYAAFAQEAGHD